MSERHVLVVEDDALIALEIEIVAGEAGADCVTLCASLAEAEAAFDQAIAVALLDIDLRDGTSFSLARRLRARGIACIFVSDLRAEVVPDDLKTAPFVVKPFFEAALRRTIEAALPSA